MYIYIYIFASLSLYIYREREREIIHITKYEWSGVEWSGTDLAGGRGATAVGQHGPPLLTKLN